MSSGQCASLYTLSWAWHGHTFKAAGHSVLDFQVQYIYLLRLGPSLAIFSIEDLVETETGSVYEEWLAQAWDSGLCAVSYA